MNVIEDIEEEENLGSFTVNMIVPDIATINPFNKPFCMHQSSSQLSIPIHIKGTSGPWEIKYRHALSPDVIFTLKMITPVLNVELPGSYEVLSIKSEANDIEASITNPSIRVTSCPIIEWSESNPKEVCLSESKESIGIKVQGDYPIQVTLKHTFSNKNIPIEVKCESADCSIDFVNQAGLNSFEIVKIKDAEGNVGCFAIDGSEECAYTDTIAPHEIKVRSLPIIKFTDTQIIKRNSIDQSVIIQVEKEDYVRGVIEHVDTKESINIHDRSVRVERAGIYKIKSATDGVCDNSALDDIIVEVVEVFKPSFSFQEIQSKDVKECARGGLSIALNIVGNYPIQLKTRLVGNDADEVSIVDIDSAESAHRMNINPSMAGAYSFEIQEVKDMYFDWLKLDNQPIKFNVYPQTTIQVIDSQTTYCKNDPITIPLNIQGVSPWQIKYMIKHNGVVKKFDAQLEHVGENMLSIGELSASGRHEIVILEARDGQGCTFDTSDINLNIDIRKERPSASFKSLGVKSYLDTESPEFEIELNGIPPFNVGYKVNGADEIMYSDFETNTGLIKATEFGECEIVSVNDKFCAGVLTMNSKSASVAFKRPTLKFDDTNLNLESNDIYSMKPMCESGKSNIKLNMVSDSKSTLKYEHSIGSVIDPTLLTIESKNGMIEIPMIITPGEHSYNLIEISDANYQVPMNVQINQKVFAAPRINTFKASPKNNKCFVANSNRNIDINAQGESPFTLTYTIHGQTLGKKTLIEVFNSELHTMSLPTFETNDSHNTIDVIGFKDNNGCEMIDSNTKHSTRIVIGKQTKLEEIKVKRDACISDLVMYRITGQSPFVMKVKFDTGSGIEEYTESVDDSIIGVHLGKSGRVVSVGSCDNDGCCVEIDGNMIVHESPRLIVGDGANISRDIVQGGETNVSVSFIGVSPFAFSYKRKSLIKEETVHVKDIQENEYTVRTKDEGKFTFLSVSDKFCKYPLPKNQNRNKANIIIV